MSGMTTKIADYRTMCEPPICMDPEGNRVELWEPAPGMSRPMGSDPGAPRGRSSTAQRDGWVAPAGLTRSARGRKRSGRTPVGSSAWTYSPSHVVGDVRREVRRPRAGPVAGPRVIPE